jgi:hypothetical protein
MKVCGLLCQAIEAVKGTTEQEKCHESRSFQRPFFNTEPADPRAGVGAVGDDKSIKTVITGHVSVVSRCISELGGQLKQLKMAQPTKGEGVQDCCFTRLVF